MKGFWLTFANDEPNDLASSIENLAFDCSVIPAYFDETNVAVDCQHCGQAVSGTVFSRKSAKGQELIRKTIETIHRQANSKGKVDCEKVVMAANHVAQTALVEKPTCDCDFRFHQIFGVGHYVYFIDGRRFLDDVDDWMVCE